MLQYPLKCIRSTEQPSYSGEAPNLVWLNTVKALSTVKVKTKLKQLPNGSLNINSTVWSEGKIVEKLYEDARKCV